MAQFVRRGTRASRRSCREGQARRGAAAERRRLSPALCLAVHLVRWGLEIASYFSGVARVACCRFTGGERAGHRPFERVALAERPAVGGARGGPEEPGREQGSPAQALGTNSSH